MELFKFEEFNFFWGTHAVINVRSWSFVNQAIGNYVLCGLSLVKSLNALDISLVCLRHLPYLVCFGPVLVIDMDMNQWWPNGLVLAC